MGWHHQDAIPLNNKGGVILQGKITLCLKGIVIVCLLPMLFCLFAGCENKAKKQEKNLLAVVEEYKGYEREIGQDEYDFYTSFIKRDLTEEVTTLELKQKIEDYANKVNAMFYLANKLGVCEPYSYENLKIRMEQENELRKIKKEEGEAFYGPEQFTLEQFFQYSKDTTEANLRTYLESWTDADTIEKAQVYYEENKEKFRVREAVTYEVTEKNTTQIVTADRIQMNLLANADPGLADFLELGEEKEQYEDVQEEGKRIVIIKEIRYNEEGFEANKEAAISAYIQQCLYQELIEMVAENNPVSFRLEIN